MKQEVNHIFVFAEKKQQETAFHQVVSRTNTAKGGPISKLSSTTTANVKGLGAYDDTLTH